MDKAELYFYSDLNEAWHWAENALVVIEKVRENLNNYASNRFVCDYFKPYGADAEEKLEVLLDIWYIYAKHLIGKIYMNFDWLEDAENALNEASKYSKEIKDKLLNQSWIARIKTIRSIFQFEDFEKLYNEMRDHEIELPSDYIAGIGVGYVLSCLLSGKEVSEREIMESVKTNLMFYAPLLATANKIFGRFDREEVLTALEKLKTEQAINYSFFALASVLKMLIENEKGKALEVARAVSTRGPPLLRRLFAELADGIQRGDEEETNKALIKLFYYHL